MKATSGLALAMLVPSFLLASVFPYADFLAIHLIPNLDTESAGHYAGLVGSSFMFGHMFISYALGNVANWHGMMFIIKTLLLL